MSLHEWKLFATASQVSICSSPLDVANPVSGFYVKLVLVQIPTSKKRNTK